MYRLLGVHQHSSFLFIFLATYLPSCEAFLQYLNRPSVSAAGGMAAKQIAQEPDYSHYDNSPEDPAKKHCSSPHHLRSPRFLFRSLCIDGSARLFVSHECKAAPACRISLCTIAQIHPSDSRAEHHIVGPAVPPGWHPPEKAGARRFLCRRTNMKCFWIW
jgi:hypothetical protein